MHSLYCNIEFIEFPSRFPMLYKTVTHPITLLQYAFTQTFINNSYNFYVDFKGLLYFDDGSPNPICIKDYKFITQLYRHLQPTTKQHTVNGKNYPNVSQFWGENNYVRSAISPVIFSHINYSQMRLQFSLGQSCKFDPHALRIDASGRIWHSFTDQIHGVFSNDLLASLVDNISECEDEYTLSLTGETVHLKSKWEMDSS